jgi:deazaflavin-dependent oxidoreductase (nitroreductase family)
MLLLTTTGRRSGNPHTVPLLYLPDKNRLVVIASYGGRHRNPDWYQNLVACPQATVLLPGSKVEVAARTATEAERGEWWPMVVAAYPGYAEYQARTDRQIPVVFLEPSDPTFQPGLD